MDFIRSGGYPQNNQDLGSRLKTMFTFTDISDKTQKHLTKVYTTLLVLSALCALGMYVNQTFIVSGFFMNLISICLSIYFIF